jgi:drug/metabolite transporter (DMT)-like permease
MDDLKSIWNQVNCSPDKIEIQLNNRKESIFEKLEKERDLKRRFNPLLFTFILVFSLGFGFLVFHNQEYSISKFIGVCLIALASISIAVFSQVIKMPLSQFEHDKSSIIFLKLVKQKLDQSKTMLLLGLVLQFIFLTLGLYLIIFYNATPTEYRFLYIFLGAMIGLAGAAIGGCFAYYNTHYKSTYKLINEFLGAEF